MVEFVPWRKGFLYCDEYALKMYLLQTHFLKFLRKKLQDEDASLKPFLQGISVFLFDQEVQRLTVEVCNYLFI